MTYKILRNPFQFYQDQLELMSYISLTDSRFNMLLLFISYTTFPTKGLSLSQIYIYSSEITDYYLEAVHIFSNNINHLEKKFLYKNKFLSDELIMRWPRLPPQSPFHKMVKYKGGFTTSRTEIK